MIIGETVFADPSDIFAKCGEGTVSYQWQRDGVDIPGATGGEYVLTSADVGCRIRAAMTFIDAAGVVEMFVSGATDPVEASGSDLLGVDVGADSAVAEMPLETPINGHIETPAAPAGEASPPRRKSAAAAPKRAPARRRYVPKTFTLTPAQIEALEGLAREAYLAGEVKRPDVSFIVRRLIDAALEER